MQLLRVFCSSLSILVASPLLSPLSLQTPAVLTYPPPNHLTPHPSSYVPFLAQIFSIVPLTLTEWGLVMLFALPVILIDEILKLLGRRFFGVKMTRHAAEVHTGVHGGGGGRRLKAE